MVRTPSILKKILIGSMFFCSLSFSSQKPDPLVQAVQENLAQESHLQSAEINKLTQELYEANMDLKSKRIAAKSFESRLSGSNAKNNEVLLKNNIGILKIQEQHKSIINQHKSIINQHKTIENQNKTIETYEKYAQCLPHAFGMAMAQGIHPLFSWFNQKSKWKLKNTETIQADVHLLQSLSFGAAAWGGKVHERFNKYKNLDSLKEISIHGIGNVSLQTINTIVLSKYWDIENRMPVSPFILTILFA